MITAVLAGLSLFSSMEQAKSMQAQGEFADRMSKINARRAVLMGKDAILRGERESQKYAGQVKQTLGSQRAALAAQGIDISSGSAAEITQESRLFATENVAKIRNNAFREAMGYEIQAEQESLSGFMAKSSAESQARSTLISGGFQAIGHMQQGGYFSKQTKAPTTTTGGYGSTSSSSGPTKLQAFDSVFGRIGGE